MEGRKYAKAYSLTLIFRFSVPESYQAVSQIQVSSDKSNDGNNVCSHLVDLSAKHSIGCYICAIANPHFPPILYIETLRLSG